MKEDVLSLFYTYPQYAFLLSLFLNIVVAILGVVPSVFITAANILFFGFWPGVFLSFCGEAIGAIVAFLLYRAGFKKRLETKTSRYKFVNKLLVATGWNAIYAVIALRLIPFVPSGVVTFTAAIGRIGIIAFVIASSLGKIPALLIEGYAAYQVTAFGWQGKLILLITGFYLLYLLYKRWK